MPHERRICAEEMSRRLNLQYPDTDPSIDVNDFSVHSAGDIVHTEQEQLPLHEKFELFDVINDDEFIVNHSDYSDVFDDLEERVDEFVSPSGICWSPLVPPVSHLQRNYKCFRQGTTVNSVNELQAFSSFCE